MITITMIKDKGRNMQDALLEGLRMSVRGQQTCIRQGKLRQSKFNQELIGV